MPEKSFLEILSEKIEKQIRNDLSGQKMSSQKQSKPQSENEKSTQNVDNSIGEQHVTGEKSTGYHQWISQIPMGKIHFATPRQHVLGRIYPVQPPRPKVEQPRKKHLLSEKQMQSVVYFWGFQIRLKEDFTGAELKKAFRALAHRLHPDRNEGRTKAFIELKAHYQCLLSVLN